MEHWSHEKSLNSPCHVEYLLTSCAHSTTSASFLLGCGKSTLLKMIAGLLPTSSKSTISGSVTVNGVESTDPSLVWSNIVAYVDQIDRLHGYLTVKETMQFAWDCRSGGTHRSPRLNKELSAEEVQRLTKELDEEGWLVNLVLDAIGLARVKDTFVGNDKVRGVSGGQRKRVTVGEMMCVSSQVQMFDEISTGLDGKLYTLVEK
jgi:ABC-type multidrug transport system ATPase subunit